MKNNNLKKGDVVYLKNNPNPFKIVWIFEDLVSIKKHYIFPGYKEMEQWEKDFAATWSIDDITLQTELMF